MDNLFGEVHFLGVFSNEQLQARAELDLDSATYKSLQLTQINGPIWIEDSQVLIGGWAPPGRLLDVGLRDATLASGTPSPAGQSAGPRRLTAHVVGGIAEVDMRIVLDNTPTYRIRASLSQARLDKCAQEMAAGRQNLKGKVFAAVDLNGTGRSTGTLHGSGELHLREGDVYELPVMISLLKILSIREPDRSGFSSGDVRFHIQGRHISLTDISFRGDAISLLGRGEMDFDHNINLLLHAVVGRGQLNIPVIREIYRGASEQILGIRVGGTLQKPEIRGEPFPVARELIESLREEMDQRQAQTDLRRSQTGRTQPPYARNPNFRTR